MKNTEISISVILDKRESQKNKNGKYPIKLRIYLNGKKRYYKLIHDTLVLKKESMSIKVFSVLWLQQSTDNDKRDLYESIIKQAENIVSGMNTFSFDGFKTAYYNQSLKVAPKTLQDYFNEKITRLDQLGRLQTSVLYKSTLASLLNYDSEISFDKVDKNYLENYQNEMENTNHSLVTVGMYMRNLRHIFNLSGNISPFGKDKYKIPSGNAKPKVLTRTELDKLKGYKPSNYNESQAFNYWLFSYYSSGINFVDIANLKVKNSDKNIISFIRQKTKHTVKQTKMINIHLTPKALDILNLLRTGEKANDYLFPILSMELDNMGKYRAVKQHIKTTNKYIRIIAKKIGINENITTYWARHTYTTISNSSGINISHLQAQLGHTSIVTTQNYIGSLPSGYAKKATDIL